MMQLGSMRDGAEYETDHEVAQPGVRNVRHHDAQLDPMRALPRIWFYTSSTLSM